MRLLKTITLLALCCFVFAGCGGEKKMDDNKEGAKTTEVSADKPCADCDCEGCDDCCSEGTEKCECAKEGSGSKEGKEADHVHVDGDADAHAAE